jgi:hypothetical protein
MGDLPMEAVVWTDRHDVRIALARLGLTVDLLSQVVRAGIFARHTRTENDAPSAPGYYQWNEMVRSLREPLVAEGWDRSNEDGLPTIINAAKQIAIAISSGNENTGLADRHPGTKYHKGPGTVDRITSNAELFLPYPDYEIPVPRRRDSDKFATWTMLFRTTQEEVRSELSLPTMIDRSGQISGWRERIVIPPAPLDGDGYKKLPAPDFGPDVDIEIRRRA